MEFREIGIETSLAVGVVAECDSLAARSETSKQSLKKRNVLQPPGLPNLANPVSPSCSLRKPRRAASSMPRPHMPVPAERRRRRPPRRLRRCCSAPGGPGGRRYRASCTCRPRRAGRCPWMQSFQHATIEKFPRPYCISPSPSGADRGDPAAAVRGIWPLRANVHGGPLAGSEAPTTASSSEAFQRSRRARRPPVSSFLHVQTAESRPLPMHVGCGAPSATRARKQGRQQRAYSGRHTPPFGEASEGRAGRCGPGAYFRFRLD